MLIYPDGLFFDLWIFRPFPIQVVASTELFVVSYVGQDHSVAGVLAWSRGLHALRLEPGHVVPLISVGRCWKMLEDPNIPNSPIGSASILCQFCDL